MTPRITADEARTLLDAREAKGAWRAGTVEGEGKVWAHDPDALGGPSVGEVCIFNANTYRPHNGNRALAAAAPDLAATVISQAAEIARLRSALTPEFVDVRLNETLRAEVEHLTDTLAAARAILAGRTTPPTEAEIEAHHRAGGTWYVASTHGRALTTTRGDAIALCAHLAANKYPATWWAIDVRGRPCAWPVVAEVSP